MKQLTYSDEHAVALADGPAASEEGDQEHPSSDDHGRDRRQLVARIRQVGDGAELKLHGYPQPQ